MKGHKYGQRIVGVLAGAAAVVALLMAMGGSTPVVADDTEIFIAQNNTGVKPNILFVLDTSGSMDTEVISEPLPYNPAKTYTGSCASDKVYWVRYAGEPVNCGSSNYVNATNFHCKKAVDTFATAGVYYATKAAQFSTSNTRWQAMSSSAHDRDVECVEDLGIHGNGTADFVYPTDSTAKWSKDENQQISWSANNTNRDYTFFSANYINWYYSVGDGKVDKTRLQVMKEVIADLMGKISGVNVGLMRYSYNTYDGCSNSASAQGGMVTFAVKDIDSGTTRTDLVNTVNGYTANGCTPLSETLYEAALYLRGSAVDYGSSSRIYPDSGGSFPSVAASRVDGQASSANYRSPLQYSCQKNFVVYLTDGEPTADTSADTKIQALPGFSTLVGSCDGTGNGRCLDDLAEYMFKADMQPNLAGTQSVTSYWIGFGQEVSGSALLQKAAARGGGQFYTATNTTGLSAVLTNIVTEILKTNSTFTAPSVSVNAFNRTQTLNDLYVSVFRPESTFRWPGNVKKYQVSNGQIRDAANQPAVDAGTGFFSASARSFWSASNDGADVTLGGAANRQPTDPDTRKLYTDISATADLTAAANHLKTTNTAISDGVLGVGGVNQPSRANLIEWTRGRDVQDADLDEDVTEARRSMGDPLHAKPSVVIYGGTAASPNINDAVMYVTTNNGYLHAIDVVTGDELWSFMPQDLLGDILDLYLNTAVQSKHYGLDGELRVLKYDVDQDGIVESADGDKVLLFFGQGRGGNNYYALDVTNKNQPLKLWTRGPAQLTGLAQTWSAPMITRVKISGVSQNSQKLVLVFAGGYDDTQDSYNYNTDNIGNSIYMIDALTGALLWRASNSGANLNLTRMVHSIPSNMTVLDLDGDTFGDRMYVGDTGGLVWRFDIVIDSDTATAGVQIPTQNQLVTGGVIADFGASTLTAPQPLASTRRFYNAPDVSLVRRRGKPTFFNIAIGSGYRGHPLDKTVQDRFYALRDYNPMVKLTQTQYNAITAVKDADMVDVTTVASAAISDTAAGWKLELRLPTGYLGEKVLAESRTFGNTIFFPTYLPNVGAGDACAPAAGNNRAYIVSVINGAPVVEQDGVFLDANADGVPDTGNTLSVTDRYTNLRQGGIAPEIAFLFPGRVTNTDPNTTPDPYNGQNPNNPFVTGVFGGGNDPIICLSGAEVLGACTNFNARIKTFWRDGAAN